MSYGRQVAAAKRDALIGLFVACFFLAGNEAAALKTTPRVGVGYASQHETPPVSLVTGIPHALCSLSLLLSLSLTFALTLALPHFYSLALPRSLLCSPSLFLPCSPSLSPLLSLTFSPLLPLSLYFIPSLAHSLLLSLFLFSFSISLSQPSLSSLDVPPVLFHCLYVSFYLIFIDDHHRHYHDHHHFVLPTLFTLPQLQLNISLFPPLFVMPMSRGLSLSTVFAYLFKI